LPAFPLVLVVLPRLLVVHGAGLFVLLVRDLQRPPRHRPVHLGQAPEELLVVGKGRVAQELDHLEIHRRGLHADLQAVQLVGHPPIVADTALEGFFERHAAEGRGARRLGTLGTVSQRRAGAPERGEDLLLGAAAQAEEEKGILVEEVPHEHQDSGDVAARGGPLGARALGVELVPALGKEADPRGAEQLLDVARDVTVQEVHRVGDVLGHQPHHRLPHLVGERGQPQPHPARGAVRLADGGRHRAHLGVQIAHLAAAHVEAARGQGAGAQPVAQCPEPAARPPRARRGARQAAAPALAVEAAIGRPVRAAYGARRLVPVSHPR